MNIYTFDAANDTLITADDSHWQINTLGAQTIKCNGANQGKISTNGGASYRFYQNGQGQAQISQIVSYPNGATGGTRRVTLQTVDGIRGYDLQWASGASPQLFSLRKNGTFINDTGNATGFNHTTTTLTIQLALDIAGNVNGYVANGIVADASVSGTNVISYFDASPLTGGYPGIVLSETTIGDAPIGFWTDLTKSSSGVHYSPTMSGNFQ